jgi:rhodanese-related sulfurtransferase
MKTITPVELQKILATQPGLPVLDVRTPAEFDAVHAPQAHNIPLDALDPKSLYGDGKLPKDQPVYLLCQAGGRATKAAEKFARQGFDYGVVVEGGTNAWVAAGLPVKRGQAAISLERQVRIAAGSLVFTGVLLALTVNRYFIVIPAFVGAGLVFAGITDWCGMGLLLAKAPWNRRSSV